MFKLPHIWSGSSVLEKEAGMKILLIDNHVLFREALCHVLQQLSGGVGEILEAGSFPDALKLAGQHPDLDLVLLELHSPGSGGVVSVKMFRQRYPHIPVVVLSSEEDCQVINKALSYGANGFVGKSATVSTLLNTLNSVLSGSIDVPQLLRQPGLAAANNNDRTGNRGSNTSTYGLTARQMDVLRYLTAGLSNREIAETINLAEGTVKSHVAVVYQILRVKSRIEATRVARQLGLADMYHGEHPDHH